MSIVRHFLIGFGIAIMAFVAEPRVADQHLTDQHRAEFQRAKTARIVVKQSYSNAPAVNLSFEKTLRGLLKYLGLSEVHGQEVADLTFNVEALGSPLGRNYFGQTRRGNAWKYLYTGATVSGTIYVRGADGQVVSRSFNGTVEPRDMVFDIQIDQFTTPAEAPFGSAFIAGKANFLTVLGQLLIEMFGAERVATAFVDEDTYVSDIGREGLLKHEPARAVSISLDSIRQNNLMTRKAGAIALVAIIQQFPQALELLVSASTDKDPNVRREIIYALTPINDPRVRDVMVRALNDPDRSIRILGASRLEYNYDKRATEPLLLALRDRDPQIRWSAATSLKGAGMRAIEPLITALKDKDEHVRQAAHQSLKAATRQNFGDDPKVWLQWWKEKKPIYEKAEAQMQKYLEMERQRTKPQP